MNTLLIFFALPIATIIISIAVQKILKCPPLVAAIIFAIFLVVTFIIGDLTFLVSTVVYTIISFITAVIVCFICRIVERSRRNYCNNNCDSCFDCSCGRNRRNDSNNLLTINSNCQNNGNGDLLTISSNDCNGTSNDLLTISSNNFNGNNNCNNNCNCNNYGNNTNGVTARINVIPTSNNNGRSGCNCGFCRR